VNIIETSELSDSERSKKGFGSSGIRWFKTHKK
jgi:dUTPase